VGETAQLIAEPLDAQGNVLSGRSVAWSSGRPNVATVSSTGAVTALSPGSAIITATVERKVGVGAITVAAAAVASVAMSPTSATLVVGQTVQLGAQPRDASGRPLVTWSSSDTQIAVVDNTGRILGMRRGTATITATSGGKAATASVRVRRS